ncbi:chemotaxis protein CheA [Thiospirochaeta perfilievii]|uniref:Chemotaxis protein CheA n=1 Tax=Thiospirochaeta perfilievii TaxID=252967 RepID=A0A5C1QBF5_9SPIO|nr:chemotaxis protein CheA [Thiospirochaeta perfilievii]QEN03994.1 chemotaxis protein CheA [Thiospirochaeta perfilievii]
MEDDNFIKIFKEEALELLGHLEDSLLELESSPDDEDLISAVFRVMHTVKGSAGMVGLDLISKFTHEVESILESVRSGDIKVSKGFIDYTLRSRDIILSMINDPEYRIDDQEAFFVDFKNALNENYISPDDNKESITYRVIFKPEPKMFFTGTNPLMMVHEVLELGDGLVIPYYEKIPKLSNLNTEECYVYWEIYITTQKSVNKIHDIFIFVDAPSEVTIEEWELNSEEPIPEKLGDLLVKRGSLKKEELDKALKEQHKLGEILVKESMLSEHEIKNALKAQTYINKTKTKKIEAAAPANDSIRINSNKLDSLIDLVGEIVTIYAQMLQLSHDTNDSKLISIIERFGLLTEELRDNSMSMRMLPIGSTFSRFRRLVRDLSSELGKKIELVTEGAETELDKNVIEQLHDPLVHIIRNCIDHGIESPTVRKANGKDETGTIKLSAIHAGASVQIVIQDDGGGLNREKIRSKGIARGLIRDGEEILDDDLFNLIFAPGFSTAASITNVSGRGVGLDVVKKQIEELKGSVAITSEEGKYTRITLTLPITLAIIEGLLVNIGGDSYVIPLSTVEACVELKEENKDHKSGKNVITFREKLVPYIDLRTFFEVEGRRRDIEQIVIVNSNSSQIGLLVDNVIGGNQTVIKSLGSMYRHIKEISGAAILGDGSVALVFDIEQLVRVVQDFEEISVGN